MAETKIAFDDADAYDRYMGRWSRAIGEKFLAWLDAPKNLSLARSRVRHRRIHRDDSRSGGAK